jgi:hypothetical protein
MNAYSVYNFNISIFCADRKTARKTHAHAVPFLPPAPLRSGRTGEAGGGEAGAEGKRNLSAPLSLPFSRFSAIYSKRAGGGGEKAFPAPAVPPVVPHGLLVRNQQKGEQGEQGEEHGATFSKLAVGLPTQVYSLKLFS